jgi:hypothetical protein
MAVVTRSQSRKKNINNKCTDENIVHLSDYIESDSVKASGIIVGLSLFTLWLLILIDNLSAKSTALAPYRY